MPKTPSDHGGGPELVTHPSWPLRPLSSLVLLTSSASNPNLVSESLRWDPAWAWEQLALSARSRREPIELLSQARWWKLENAEQLGALDRLWRNSVAAAIAARRLAETANFADLELVERLAFLHRLDYWLIAISDASLLVRLVAKPASRSANRSVKERLGESPGDLAFRWSDDSERTEELIDWCAYLDRGGRRARPEGSKLLEWVAKARSLADRTRWGLGGRKQQTSDADPRIVELEDMVERICSEPFALAESSPLAEAFARRCADLELERKESLRKKRTLEKRASALQTTLDEWSENVKRELEKRKLNALAEFAAGAGHEINNPLAVVQGRAQLLLAKERNPNGERARSLQAIFEQAQRAHWMIRDLMFIARPPELVLEQCSPKTVLEQTLKQQRTYAERRKITLSLEGEHSSGAFIADIAALKHVAEAFVRNAIEASNEGGEVSVAFKLDARRLTITFRDRGAGIDKHSAKRLFDPFYCGRSAGRGLGLGLPRAAVVVRKLGGRIRWSSSPSGTRFKVILPRKPSLKPGAG